MEMTKRVMDDMMLDQEFDVRMKLPDSSFYTTEPEVQKPYDTQKPLENTNDEAAFQNGSNR
jgi:hypothetical protein